jgi:hypothetical protein
MEYQVVMENRRISNSEYRTPKFPPDADPPSVGSTSRFYGSLFVNLQFSGNNIAGIALEDHAGTPAGESAPTPSQAGNLILDLALTLIFLAGLGLAGCATTPDAYHPAKPIEVVLFVKADKVRWQDSGLWVKRGEAVHCRAEGRWRDLHGSYGPEGNPKVLKDHLGVIAPANALLMKIDYHTNQFLPAQVVMAGKETNVCAKASGPLLFANNISLTNGQIGEMKVTVTIAPDADEDGISDYDEVTLWKTDPNHIDSDGDGFSDDQEVAERKKILQQKKPPAPP